jgi:catechol 2,3-dioxygenase-like lactoylglutathione lyase family enzyme
MGATRLALDHVAIPVRDAAATRRFYSGVLGLELVDAISGEGWDGFAWLMMIYADAEGRQLALCAFRGRRASRERIPTDARHYALSTGTPREIRAWKKRLADAGVSFREEDHGGNILEITSSPSRRHIASGRGEAAGRAVDRWVNAGGAASARRSGPSRRSRPPRDESGAGRGGRTARTRSRR